MKDGQWESRRLFNQIIETQNRRTHHEKKITHHHRRRIVRLASFGRAQDIDSSAPVGVKTVPEAGSKDISPAEMEIKDHFQQEMTDQS